jgi:hypothetical protein
MADPPPLKRGFIVVVETPQPDGGQLSRRGYLVAAESESSARAAAAPYQHPGGNNVYSRSSADARLPSNSGAARSSIATGRLGEVGTIRRNQPLRSEAPRTGWQTRAAEVPAHEGLSSSNQNATYSARLTATYRRMPKRSAGVAVRDQLSSAAAKWWPALPPAVPTRAISCGGTRYPCRLVARANALVHKVR